MAPYDLDLNSNIQILRTRLAFIEGLGAEYRNYFRERIELQKKELEAFLKEESRSHLNMSFDTLDNVIMSLLYDEQYHNKENPTDFRKYIEGLDNAMKDFFQAFKSQEEIVPLWDDDGGDAIQNSTIGMYRKLAQLRNTGKLDFVYPSANWLIHYLRNVHVHRGTIARTAHRKTLKSLDSIFPLCSIMLLSLYSYVEMLDLWLDTCKQHRKLE